MDQRSVDGTAPDGVRAQRRQLRDVARARRRADADRFQTPQWLEQSFVLPLTDRGVTAVPSQSQPDHDDFTATPHFAPRARHAEVDPAAAAAFVRPPSQEIDFARMIKRSDHCRMATRAAIASIGFAGVGLVAFLLTMDPLGVLVAIVCAVLAVIAVGVRLRLATAPVAHLGG
jgi:hypothetical protein